jgi:hypothetical protein
MKPTEAQWRMPFAVQMVPGILFLLGILLQPESPRWLTEHGHGERAEKAMAFISGEAVDSDVVQETMLEMRRDFEGRAETSIWQQLRFMTETRSTAYRSIVPSLVMFFQQATGTNAINYYSPTVCLGLMWPCLTLTVSPDLCTTRRHRPELWSVRHRHLRRRQSHLSGHGHCPSGRRVRTQEVFDRWRSCTGHHYVLDRGLRLSGQKHNCTRRRSRLRIHHLCLFICSR